VRCGAVLRQLYCSCNPIFANGTADPLQFWNTDCMLESVEPLRHSNILPRRRNSRYSSSVGSVSTVQYLWCGAVQMIDAYSKSTTVLHAACLTQHIELACNEKIVVNEVGGSFNTAQGESCIAVPRTRYIMSKQELPRYPRTAHAQRAGFILIVPNELCCDSATSVLLESESRRGRGFRGCLAFNPSEWN
jgi:hypothetical protein